MTTTDLPDLITANANANAAVATTIGALTLTPADAAVVHLAATYAKALDRAAGTEVAADRVLRRVDAEDIELQELVTALRQKLTAQTALATIGPKLLDALTALGAHPKARAAASPAPAVKPASNLERLRGARRKP